MKIIANLICLNSAPELPALLGSLEGKMDAVVAVDGGSTDGTVKILEDWGGKTGIETIVKVNAWPDNFAEQRNVCLNLTREKYGTSVRFDQKWVLMIDTDDVLLEFDRPFLEKCLESHNEFGALACRMSQGNTFFHNAQFFKLTHGAVWKNWIHEFIAVDGQKALVPVEPAKEPDGEPVGKLTIGRGHAAQHYSDPMRNVRIGRKFVEAEPNNSRARFYLGRDLMDCEILPSEQRYAEAEGHLRIYLSLPERFPEQDRFGLLLLVRILCDRGRTDEARSMLLEWIAKDPDNKSAYEALSCISDDNESGVWHRLAASACGGCILPYGSKLPLKAKRA